jgi:transcription initiation factor TFIIIB Brf1 subunit/transcription initiation factor TFIIB
MTVVGTLRKNKLEIPALFLNGKQRDVHSSVFGFTNDLTLVSHVKVKVQFTLEQAMKAQRRSGRGRVIFFL